jgi:hypothetical protein
MKQIYLTSITILFFMLSQAFTPPFSSVKVEKIVREEVMLQAGTPISFTLNQSLNSDDVEAGNSVLMIVDDDVIADNQIVIRKGERAEGQIRYLKREEKCGNCRDKYHKIDISVDRVKAIDGQQIWLYGKPFSARGKCSKCPIELNTTTLLQATVQQNTRIVLGANRR